MIKTRHIKFLHCIMAKMQHGHPRDHGLMSLITRVRNSGVREKELLTYNNIINNINYIRKVFVNL